MDWLFKYSWFIGGLWVGLGSALPFWLKQRARFRNSPEDLRGLKLMAVGTALLFIVPSFMLGAIQLAGGYESPLFINKVGPNNIFSLLSMGVMLITGALVLIYVWALGGAKTIAKYTRPKDATPQLFGLTLAGLWMAIFPIVEWIRRQ